MPLVLAADVTAGQRIWMRTFGRWATVVSAAPTGRLKFGSDTVPMIRLRLGPDARPAKSMECAGDQVILVQGREV